MQRYPRRSLHAHQQPRVSPELAGNVASSAPAKERMTERLADTTDLPNETQEARS
jgi:hypothetical protein